MGVFLWQLGQDVCDGQISFGATFEKLDTPHGPIALAKMFAKQPVLRLMAKPPMFPDTWPGN